MKNYEFLTTSLFKWCITFSSSIFTFHWPDNWSSLDWKYHCMLPMAVTFYHSKTKHDDWG